MGIPIRQDSIIRSYGRCWWVDCCCFFSITVRRYCCTRSSSSRSCVRGRQSWDRRRSGRDCCRIGLGGGKTTGFCQDAWRIKSSIEKRLACLPGLEGFPSQHCFSEAKTQAVSRTIRRGVESLLHSEHVLQLEQSSRIGRTGSEMYIQGLHRSGPQAKTVADSRREDSPLCRPYS